MAKMHGSERALWQAAGQFQLLRAEYMDLERVVIALARRQAGVLILDEAELTDLPPRSGICRVTYPDGRVVIRVVQDEPEPGHAG